MFDMGFLELALIAGIALIVLGPERLPVAARTVGRYIGQVRRFVGNFQRQIEQETRLEELNRKIMEDTKGQTFRNNDDTSEETIKKSDAQDAALARAKSNRTAEADRLRQEREAEEARAAEQLRQVNAAKADSAGDNDDAQPTDNDPGIGASDEAPSSGKSQPQKNRGQAE